MLHDAGREEECIETYQLALRIRPTSFSPWVNQTRLLDVSHMHRTVAQYALSSVFQLIHSGKIPVFNLNIIISKLNSSPHSSTPHVLHHLLEKEIMDGMQQAVVNAMRMQVNGDRLISRFEVREMEGQNRVLISRESLQVWLQGDDAIKMPGD
jgi:S-adenosylmethionine:tRNA-ribosyltransferase-isomerase (queuine synthetase)